jgi:hypothetical protein
VAQEGWCRVGSFADRTGAALALTALEASGISARIEADDGGGTSPDIGLATGGAWLVVPAADVERAHTLLDRLSWQRAEPARQAASTTRRIVERGISVLILVLLTAGVLSVLLGH